MQKILGTKRQNQTILLADDDNMSRILMKKSSPMRVIISLMPEMVLTLGKFFKIRKLTCVLLM